MDRIISALTLYTVENGMLTWYDHIYVEGTPHYLTIATPCLPSITTAISLICVRPTESPSEHLTSY